MGIRSLSLSGLALRRVSDEAVLERAREGQELAFAELYRRFHALVYGYCLARLMDPAAAEDVTQETFLRINRSRSEDEVHSARAWVFTVARSAVIDHVRRAKRMPDSLPVDDDMDFASADSDAADRMFRREDAKLVFLALARLRPRYRSALILREMHGLTSLEIGESLGLKPGAVDTLVCRARDAFGREYAALADLPGDCRRAVEYMYRERGSGIDANERAWLLDHVAGCPRCARERRLAADPKRLTVLLPLAGIRPEGLGILQRALETLGAAPASFEALGVMTAKVTAVAVATTLAVAPIAGRVRQEGRDLPRVMRADVPAAVAGTLATSLAETSSAAVIETVATVATATPPATVGSGNTSAPAVATVVVLPDTGAEVEPGCETPELSAGEPPATSAATCDGAEPSGASTVTPASLGDVGVPEEPCQSDGSSAALPPAASLEESPGVPAQ